MTPSHRTARDPRERAALAELLHRSFGYHLRHCEQWLQEVGADNVRVLLADADEVVGGLLRVPMGQFFGGRSVPSCGLTGVSIAPSARGQGTATALVTDELRALADEGWSLSTLWAATEPLYRRAGYAIGGGHHQVRVRARDVQGGRRDRPMRDFEASDDEAARRLYSRFAARRPGWLDRGDFSWRRTRELRGQRSSGYVVLDDDGRLTGHCFFRHDLSEAGYDVTITDLVYRDAASARTLLAFLADQRSLGERMTWLTAPDDALLSMLRDRHYRVDRCSTWMLRILDVPSALEQRGYPAAVSGALTLDVEDGLLERNRGRFTLEVRDGRGEVTAGGDGPGLRLGIGALASLYTGYYGPSRLREVGRLKGDERALALAEALFAGPPPSCGDFF